MVVVVDVGMIVGAGVVDDTVVVVEAVLVVGA